MTFSLPLNHRIYPWRALRMGWCDNSVGSATFEQDQAQYAGSVERTIFQLRRNIKMVFEIRSD